MKAKGRFISFLLVVDTFFAAYAYGFHSRHVLVIDPKMSPVATPVLAPAAKPVAKSVSKPAGSSGAAKSNSAKTSAKTAAGKTAVEKKRSASPVNDKAKDNHSKAKNKTP